MPFHSDLKPGLKQTMTDDPDFCQFCGSLRIEYDGSDTRGRTYWHCTDCGAHWIEREEENEDHGKTRPEANDTTETRL